MRIPFVLALLVAVWPLAEAMEQATLNQYIIEHSTDAEGKDGVVQFEYATVPMAVISDPRHDRMRIIAPVARYSEVSREQLDRMMEANFHSALDARYAVSRGIVYAAYLHPLASLDETGLQAALEQVANLALSYGKSYSSGALSFGKSRTH